MRIFDIQSLVFKCVNAYLRKMYAFIWTRFHSASRPGSFCDFWMKITNMLQPFCKILKKPALLQKPTISHMKALVFSYSEPEGWGRGIIMGAPRLPPVCYFSFRGRGGREGWFFKKNIFWLGQMSASNKCTDIVVMT